MKRGKFCARELPEVSVGCRLEEEEEHPCAPKSEGADASCAVPDYVRWLIESAPSAVESWLDENGFGAPVVEEAVAEQSAAMDGAVEQAEPEEEMNPVEEAIEVEQQQPSPPQTSVDDLGFADDAEEDEAMDISNSLRLLSPALQLPLRPQLLLHLLLFLLSSLRFAQSSSSLDLVQQLPPLPPFRPPSQRLSPPRLLPSAE